MSEARKQSREDLKLAIDARFRGPLMSFFLRRLRDRSEAEDLTQEVFLRLFSSPSFDRLEHPDAFVFTIAGNLLHDRHRRHRRSPVETAPLDGLEPFGPALLDAHDPERILLGQRALDEALRHLDELSEQTRNIFILFRLENLKQREIAALYGISQSTVEKHVTKAVLHLARRQAASRQEAER